MSEHYEESLLRGAKTGSLDLVRDSWNKVENKNATDFLGHNTLTLSIIKGHFEIFKFLVDSGANLDLVNNVTTSFNMLCGTSKYRYMKKYEGCDGFLGETALICAVKERNFPMVKYLINKGASPNIRDHERRIALYYAFMKRCDVEMIQFLIYSGSETEETRGQLDEYARYHQNFDEYWKGIRAQAGI